MINFTDLCKKYNPNMHMYTSSTNTNTRKRKNSEFREDVDVRAKLNQEKCEIENLALASRPLQEMETGLI